MAESVNIVGIGMMTPVGDSANMTATSIQGEINVYEDSSIYNKRYEPMTLALIPEKALSPLHEDLDKIAGLTSRQIRMLRIAESAFRESIASLPEKKKFPVLIAGPEQIQDCPKPIDRSFLKHLHLQCSKQFDCMKSKIFAQGRAGGFQALEEAYQLINNNVTEFVLIGGVDTYLDLYLLSTLDKDNRVLANGVMNGFAPGEGACFLLIASDKTVEKYQLTRFATLYQPALADEPGHRYSEEPYKGDGLAQAITSALEKVENEKISTVYAGFNGENFFAKEWGVASIRNSSYFEDDLQIKHPADCYGDSGAATAPLLIGLASIGIQKKYDKDPCLIFSSSEYELRGAVCVTA